MAVTSVVEPILDVDDIQGNILAGFNKDHQTLLLLSIVDPVGAKRWLRDLHPHIATTSEVLEYNRLRKAIKLRRFGAPSGMTATWVNVAFSYQGLLKLTSEVEMAGFGNGAFRQGLARRSGLIGDPTDPNRPGHPSSWEFGDSDDTTPDILLIVAADDQKALHEAVTQLRSTLTDTGARTGGSVLQEIVTPIEGATLGGDLNGHEHFGFKDGISQPGVRGRVSDVADDFLTPRLLDPAVAEANRLGKPGQPLVWPGQFLLGLPRQDDMSHDGSLPALDLDPPWTKNGSFLVARKLRQRVAAFWTSMRELSAGFPSGRAVAPFDYIAARLVGRWRSGAPVVRTPSGDSTALAVDDRLNNDFRFRTASAPLQLKPDQRLPPSNFAPAVEDKDGTICPFAAHIRKVNPRADPTEQSGPADTLTRLIIRRGIPYGPALPNFQIAADDGIERGLLFLCYQASIEQQFEFLMSQWVNRIDTPHPSGGRDALIGRHSPDANLPPSEITLTGADGQPRKLPLISNWITPVGGGYFFAPSLTAIRERLTV